MKTVYVKKVGEIGKVEEMENGLGAMQKIVGGYIERVALPLKIDLWINEEGLINGLPLNFIVPVQSKPVHRFHGDVFFASYDDEGNSVSLDEFQIAWIKNALNEVGLWEDEKTETQYMLHKMEVR